MYIFPLESVTLPKGYCGTFSFVYTMPNKIHLNVMGMSPLIWINFSKLPWVDLFYLTNILCKQANLKCQFNICLAHLLSNAKPDKR